MAEAPPKISQAIEHRVRTDRESYYWFTGDGCHYNPTQWDMREHDAVEKYILQGWLPDAPFINRNTKITAFGSCFAEHIARYLAQRNYNLLTNGETNSYIVSMKENLVNSYALRQQFDWALENRKPTTDLWYGYKAEAFGYDEQIRLATLDLMTRTDVFVLTLGLSEVWYDEPTGEVFWRAVPKEKYDSRRHKFRVSTVEENKANIRAIYDLIAKHVPKAKLIVTLSPIPLIATFRPQSALTSNAVSKAVLRAAVDEVYREVGHEGRMLYWPSYEIVMEAFGVSPYTGRFVGDRRHPDDKMIAYIMRVFEEYYCAETSARASVLRSYVEARCSTLDLPPILLRTIDAGDPAAIRAMIDERLRVDDAPTAALIAKLANEYYPQIDFTPALAPT